VCANFKVIVKKQVAYFYRTR